MLGVSICPACWTPCFQRSQNTCELHASHGAFCPPRCQVPIGYKNCTFHRIIKVTDGALHVAGFVGQGVFPCFPWQLCCWYSIQVVVFFPLLSTTGTRCSGRQIPPLRLAYRKPTERCVKQLNYNLETWANHNAICSFTHAIRGPALIGQTMPWPGLHDPRW